MKKASLAVARAHLSSLVDAAEYRKRRTLIVRHGRAVAAIVPVERDEPSFLTADEVTDMFAAFNSSGVEASAVEALLVERR